MRDRVNLEHVRRVGVLDAFDRAALRESRWRSRRLRPDPPVTGDRNVLAGRIFEIGNRLALGAYVAFIDFDDRGGGRWCRTCRPRARRRFFVGMWRGAAASTCTVR